MDTIGKRVRACRELRKMSQQSLADKIGVTRVAISHLENRPKDHGDRSKHAGAIAAALNVDLDWLVTGEGHMSTDGEQPTTADGCAEQTTGVEFVMVPRFNIKASAGNGHIVHSELVVDHLAFKRPWLLERVADTTRVALVDVEGSSMEPTLRHGDLVLVDLAISRILDGSIYLIGAPDGSLLVKRVQRLTTGGIRIVSDNKALFTNEDLTEDQAASIRFLGRVVWFGRGL